MQISAPPGILMQFSRSVKSSWAKALVNNYGKRKERLTPEFQTIWHLMRFSSAIGNLRSIRFRIISKMRNGNDDFSTSSIEQPNGSSQKHHTRRHSPHTCQNWVWYLFCKLSIFSDLPLTRKTEKSKYFSMKMIKWTKSSFFSKLPSAKYFFWCNLEFCYSSFSLEKKTPIYTLVSLR